MKIYFALILLFILHTFLNFSYSQDWQCGDTLVDERDGQLYPTTQIFDNCWMAKNMNIGVMVHIDSTVSDNDIIEKYCYNNMEDSCTHYGGLYNWNEAMNYSAENGAQGICPDGWHIMTLDEWLNMIDSLGSGAIAGGKLKETGYRYWHTPNTDATNEVGFSGRGSGRIRDTGSNNSPYFDDILSHSLYWSSTRYTFMGELNLDAYGLDYNSSFTHVYFFDAIYVLKQKHSIRCVKDKNLSIGENKVNFEISVQPNPFNLKTEVLIEEGTNIKTLKLFDVHGRAYYPRILRLNNKVILYRGNLSSGIYSLIIQTDRNNILRTKIVIK